MNAFVLAILFLAGSVDAESGIDIKFIEREEKKVVYVPQIDLKKAPVIDGVLDDAAWQSAYKNDKFYLPGGFKMPNKTVMYMGWGKKYLYIAALCEFKDIAKFRQVGPQNTDVSKLIGKNNLSIKRDLDTRAKEFRVWAGDNIEFRISKNDKLYHMFAAPNGASADLLSGNKKWNPEWQVRGSFVEKSFSVELAIPLTVLDIDVRKKTQFIMDLGRTDRSLGAEVIAGITDTYGKLEIAPLFILQGSGAADASEDLQKLITKVDIITDRVVYPDFVPAAAGRVSVTVDQGSSLKDKIKVKALLISGRKNAAESKVLNLKASAFDFDLPLTMLRPGKHNLEFQFFAADKKIKSSNYMFETERVKQRSRGEISLTLPAAPEELSSWGLTFGVPFPWGALFSADNVKLLDSKNSEIPMQAEITSRWSKKGSIRWLLVDTVLPLKKSEQKFKLVYGPNIKRKEISDPLTLTEVKLADKRDSVVIKNNLAEFEFPKTKSEGLSKANFNGRVATADNALAGAFMKDEAEVDYYGSLDPAPQVIIDAAGPVKTAVRVIGRHYSKEGKKLGKYILRYIYYKGQPRIKVNHTFVITENTDKVRYRAIGYAFPVRSEKGVFGTPRVTPFNLANAKEKSAYLLQQDYRTSKAVADNKFLDEFGKSEGWISNAHYGGGSITMSVRDFWQQYPKELEVTSNSMNAYAWPLHNGKALHGPENTSFNNLHQFWHVHEGKLLDFKAPQWLTDLVAQKDKGYAKSMSNNNAMGLAKTHDILVQFGDSWEQSRHRSGQKIFQYCPAVTVDPEWVAGTEVFGPLAARDTKKFQREEEVIDGLIKTIIRQHHEDRDYGMFNYGNAHHKWHSGKRRWLIHRLWRATHHHWPRWPWLEYARSGSKDFFDYARRNIRHVADISHAHYADEEFSSSGYPRKKIVGGICDYKGIVHWNAGERMGYNSVADALLHSYYMTGDMRSLTTAMQHGSAILAKGGTRLSREGSARTISLIALYYRTWDNNYLELAKRHIDGYVKDQRDDGSFASSNTATTWAPHFQRYYELTKDSRVLVLARKHLDWVLSGSEEEVYEKMNNINRGLSIYSVLNNMTWVYLQTGEEKYLQAAAWRVSLFNSIKYEGDDWRFRGAPNYPKTLAWSWMLRDLPVYLAGVKKYGKEVKPLPLVKPQGARAWVLVCLLSET
jgi:hypothetical protein